MENTTEIGYIYLLTNPAFPGFVKIGMTYAEDIKTRMNQLYSTGVPFPFELAYAAKVKTPEKVESALHTDFSPNRINPKREFFEIDTLQAISIIKLLEISDETKEVEAEIGNAPIDKIEIEAGKEYTKRRPRFDFFEMGIPLESEIVCIKNGETAIVKSEREIEFRGELSSITNATKIILNVDYGVQSGPYWTYNGRLLRDLYNETYGVQGL